MKKSAKKRDDMLASMVGLVKLGAAAFLLYLGTTAYLHWLDEDGLFSIKAVAVSGSHYLSDTEVIHLAGLESAERIWNTDLQGAVTAIETYPFIEKASVVRKIPDKLEIKITEKEPVALLNFKGDLYALDRDGLVLPSIPGSMYRLPVISGSFKGGLRTGSAISRGSAFKALTVVTAIIASKPAMYNDISEVTVKSDGNIVVYTREHGIPVQVGSGQILRKVVCLGAIMEQLKKERTLSKTSYIDLRFKGQVVVGTET